MATKREILLRVIVAVVAPIVFIIGFAAAIVSMIASGRVGGP